MLRAVRIGLFIGTLIGMSACASASDRTGGASDGYGSIDLGRGA